MAEIPAFADRPTISEGSLAWAGQRAVAAEPAALAAEPAAPDVAPVAGGTGKGKGKGKAKGGRGRKK